MTTTPIKIYVYDEISEFTWKSDYTLRGGRAIIPPNPIPLLNFRTKKFIDTPYFIQTTNPDDAEFFLLPKTLGRYIDRFSTDLNIYCDEAIVLIDQLIQRLPYFEKAPERHVFFSSHDSSDLLPSPVLQAWCCVEREHKTDKILCIPYGNEPITVDTFPTLAFLSEHRKPLEWDISFVGNVTQSIRRLIISSFENTNLKTQFIQREAFWGFEKDKNQKKEHLRSLAFSYMVLAPRGQGLHSHRFYEAMSAGRVPVLITKDNAVLPFEDLIDYKSAIIRVPEDNWKETGAYVEAWLDKNGHEKLLEMGKNAKEIFHTQLRRDHWPRHFYRWLDPFR